MSGCRYLDHLDNLIDSSDDGKGAETLVFAPSDGDGDVLPVAVPGDGEGVVAPASAAAAAPVPATPASGGSDAAAQPIGAFMHPQAPDLWWSVRDPPEWSHDQRIVDQDFRSAYRQSKYRMKQDRQSQCRADAESMCARHRHINTDDYFKDIDFRFWSFFEFTASWHSIWFVASQPFVTECYIGITECPSWRWWDCEGHNNMVSHHGEFRRMYVLGCNFGDTCSAMEKLLQAKLTEHKPAKSPHRGYRRGPITPHRVYFLYKCIKVRSSV